MTGACLWISATIIAFLALSGVVEVPISLRIFAKDPDEETEDRTV
jgi:hypothetical protein